MGSNYIQQRMERDKRYFEIGMRTGAQLAADFFAMSLHDPDVMGRNRVLARTSIDKIFENASKLDEHFSTAFDCENVEADYVREEWDSVLREIYGEDTDPFEKRYPYAKDIKYLKPRKGWI